MSYRIVHMFFLWTMLTEWCSGRPDSLNDLDHMAISNYNEEALKRLLRVFGLDGRVPQQRSASLPPQYMLDLYKSYSDSTETGPKLRYSKANTVRSFFDRGETADKGHYFYELTESIPKHEDIVDAEFHFFTNPNALRLQQQSSHVIQIQLYEEQKNATAKLLQARVIGIHSSGWEVFRVKSSVTKWFADPELNMGISVKILDSSGHQWSNRRLHRLQNYRKPILIVFSRDPRTIGGTTLRKTMDSDSLQAISAKESAKQNNSETGNARSTRSALATENGLCTRHELRVDFEKLGWSSWIISPKWYDAFICSGACTFPLGQNQRPTNHATVQSIVHELGLSDGIDAPCCVPSELHPVSLLYFDEHSNVVLKQYDDMVAAGCGCQ